MTPSEFKAWFEGFTESMDGPPSLKQWERIQARVKQITGAPTTYPVFVDRYAPAPRWYWNGNSTGQPYIRAEGTLISNSAGAPSDARLTAAAALDAGNWLSGGAGAAFDSHSAMNALGKADAADLKAA